MKIKFYINTYILYIQSNKKNCFIIRGKSSGGGTLYNRYINGAGGMKISAYTIKRENVLNLYIMYGFYVRLTKIKTS